MLSEANIIYETRYDLDLGGEMIEMQEGCTLKFEEKRKGSAKQHSLLLYLYTKLLLSGWFYFFYINIILLKVLISCHYSNNFHIFHKS